MRTSALLLVAVLLAAMLAPTVEAGRDGRDGRQFVSLTGVISAVGDNGFALHTDRGDLRIRVIDRTYITLNGEPARLADLQRGDRARVRAVVRHTRLGPRLIALRVAAFRRTD